MKAQEMPGCCGLRIVSHIECLGRGDAYSKRLAARFDELPIKGILGGNNCTATIVTISDHEDEFDAQRTFLKARGYKLLGTWQAVGNGWDGPHTLYLYGSKEFTRGRKGQ